MSGDRFPTELLDLSVEPCLTFIVIQDGRGWLRKEDMLRDSDNSGECARA